jgi:dTDP-4-amino-4,6-dideoxy-D-galactose acyltransferase
MNTAEDIYAEYLNWDSQLFGKKICKITKDKLDENQLVRCIEWAKINNIDCVYYLIDSSDISYVNIAERYGFNFIDFRITLDSKISDYSMVTSKTISSHNIRTATSNDLDKVKSLARFNHTDSRFFKDSRFDKVISEKLFELWIDRNSSSESAIILVSEIDLVVSGYIAISFQNNIGVIELIGVNPKFRGLGIGVNLISSSLDWFRNNNINTVNVVTQGTNIPALRMYHKCGFAPIQSKSWYHLWF